MVEVGRDSSGAGEISLNMFLRSVGRRANRSECRCGRWQRHQMSNSLYVLDSCHGGIYTTDPPPVPSHGTRTRDRLLAMFHEPLLRSADRLDQHVRPDRALPFVDTDTVAGCHCNRLSSVSCSPNSFPHRCPLKRMSYCKPLQLRQAQLVRILSVIA